MSDLSTSETSGVISSTKKCAPVSLPAGGILQLSTGEIITLDGSAAFRPPCLPSNSPAIIASGGPDTTSVELEEAQFTDFRDPFYASIFPQTYALAATTIMAYTLVIMLFITPRSFLDGGVVYLGRRGFTRGGGGGTSIGGRPALQKVAALTVAISLTIATVDTFRVAEEQYLWGIQNAESLQQQVLGGLELKIIRIISDTFLLLAQAQTLTRLFPRQREKVIIKWTAFALITLGILFQCLNSFLYPSPPTRPRNFTAAVPALSYLFQLSLGVLYAAWVIYYSMLKKRYAFYHAKMKNMCIVSLLSVIAVLVPVVFFVIDVSKPEFIGWGDYVRWVGAAAASVIVWEWVERTEALEREDKKDGILGREVFDGDEMMNINGDSGWVRRSRKTRRDAGGGPPPDEEGGSGPNADRASPLMSRMGGWAGRVRPLKFFPWQTGLSACQPSQSRSAIDDVNRATTVASSGTTLQTLTNRPNRRSHPAPTFSSHERRRRALRLPAWPMRPPPARTPVSRADTASATSTIYAVRYQRPSIETSPLPLGRPSLSRNSSDESPRSSGDGGAERDGTDTSLAEVPSVESSSAAAEEAQATEVLPAVAAAKKSRWRAPLDSVGLFQGKSLMAKSDERERRPSHSQLDEESSRWDLRARLEDFAATQAERIREKMRSIPDTDSLPVRVIPAPPRPGAFLNQVLHEETNNHHGVQHFFSQSPYHHAITTATANTSSSQLDAYHSQVAPEFSPDPHPIDLGRMQTHQSAFTVHPSAASSPSTPTSQRPRPEHQHQRPD